MFGALGNIASLLKQAQGMKKRMDQMQEELASKTFEADSGGGTVAATVNGRGELVKIRIEPSAIRPDDREVLEDLIVAAVNAASAKAKQASQEEMAKITGGLDMSALEGLLKSE